MENCSNCGSSDIQSRGYRNGLHRFYCWNCDSYPSEPDERESRPIEAAPKILIFDIETSYMEGSFWNLGKQIINKSQITRDWHMLSWSSKWICEPNVESQVLTPREAKKGNDYRIVSGLWDKLNEADIVISFNGDRFDIPKFNTRAMINGLLPPAPYRSVDVYKTVSRRFAFSSNSLDYVNRCLELERKIHNSGLPLWKRCIEGDANALAEMESYNRGDVVALEETYIKFLPWIKDHPFVSKWYGTEEKRCGFCGSGNLKKVSKAFETPSGLYSLERCRDCGGLRRDKESKLTKEQRAVLGKNV